MSRSALTLAEKVKVIELKEKDKLSIKEIVSRFKCGKTQIYYALKNKEKILAEWVRSKHSLTCKRLRTPEFENIDRLLYDWFVNARAKNLPISGPILQAEAKNFAEKLKQPNFKASNGWLHTFKKRHNIVWKQLNGEAVSLSSSLCQEEDNEMAQKNEINQICINVDVDPEHCVRFDDDMESHETVESPCSVEDYLDDIEEEEVEVESPLAVQDFRTAITYFQELQKFAASVSNRELLELTTRARECAERTWQCSIEKEKNNQ